MKGRDRCHATRVSQTSTLIPFGSLKQIDAGLLKSYETMRTASLRLVAHYPFASLSWAIEFYPPSHYQDLLTSLRPAITRTG